MIATITASIRKSTKFYTTVSAYTKVDVLDTFGPNVEELVQVLYYMFVVSVTSDKNVHRASVFL